MILQSAMFPMEVEFHSEKCHFGQQKTQFFLGCRPKKLKQIPILFVFGKGGAAKKGLLWKTPLGFLNRTNQDLRQDVVLTRNNT